VAALAARRLRRGFLLNTAELGFIAGLPTDVAVPGLDRARAKPAPAPVAVPGGGRGTKALGRAEVGGHAVALPVADARHHVHLLGATGSGKSTQLCHLVLDDIRARRGVVVIDPKGDLVVDVLDRLPAELPDLARRLVLIDPDQPGGAPLLLRHGPGSRPRRDPARAPPQGPTRRGHRPADGLVRAGQRLAGGHRPGPPPGDRPPGRRGVHRRVPQLPQPARLGRRHARRGPRLPARPDPGPPEPGPTAPGDPTRAVREHKIFFACAPEDAHQLARHTLPELDEHDLAHLDAYTAASRLVIDSRQTPAFTLRTLPPRPVVGQTAAIRAAIALPDNGDLARPGPAPAPVEPPAGAPVEPPVADGGHVRPRPAPNNPARRAR
jgi:hypothetical protein